jgi:hypothetical protein
MLIVGVQLVTAVEESRETTDNLEEVKSSRCRKAATAS